MGLFSYLTSFYNSAEQQLCLMFLGCLAQDTEQAWGSLVADPTQYWSLSVTVCE